MALNRTRLAALSVDLAGPQAPSEIRLIPAGRFKSSDGSGRPEGIPAGWLMNAELAARLIAAASARIGDYVIDYEHQTLRAKDNGQPAPAAGWFKQLEWRESGNAPGLYATDVRWTAAAARRIHDGEYRYISPMFFYATDGRVLALAPAALTNDPAVDGLTDLSVAALSAFFPEEEVPMLKELLKALGLPETATEAEALAALAAIRSAHTGELAALKSKTPDPAQYVSLAVLSATQNELATARTELAALKATQQAAEVDKVVAAALTAGKLTPATEAWARDLGKTNLAALTAYVEAASVVVKPGETQTGGEKPAGTGGAALTATQLAVCTAMGVAPEAFAKTLAAESAGSV